MYPKVLILVSIILSIECKQSYVINWKNGWKNEITKCGSGGEDRHSYDFNIGTLQTIGLKYEDVNSSTLVKAHGHLELRTKSSGSEVEKVLHLTEYTEENGYKRFSNSLRRETTSGWAGQSVAMTLTVKIHKNGAIELRNYVYAGSWWTVTCAWTKAFVETIEIIN